MAESVSVATESMTPVAEPSRHRLGASAGEHHEVEPDGRPDPHQAAVHDAARPEPAAQRRRFIHRSETTGLRGREHAVRVHHLDAAEAVERGAEREDEIASQPGQRGVGAAGLEGQDRESGGGRNDGGRAGPRDEPGAGEREEDGGTRRDQRAAPGASRDRRRGAGSLEGSRECLGVGEPVRGDARQGAGDRVVDGGRHRRPNVPDAGRRAGQAAGEHRGAAGAGERRRAGQHLVQNGAERVDVGGGTDRGVAGRLLRAHVRRRPEHETGAGETLVVRGDHGAGEAEVRHDRLSAGEQDVLRLDVPVDDPLPVGAGQGRGDVAGDGEGVVAAEAGARAPAGAGATRPRRTA